MEPTSVLERIASSDQTAVALREPECPLNVGIIYQDALTREWAGQECERLATRRGKTSVRCKAWKIGDLSDPDVFAKALWEAERVDTMAVAIHDAEQLPLAFYVLMDAWSRHRSRPTGALLTLLGVSENVGAHARRTEEFLRAITRQGPLKLLPEAHNSRMGCSPHSKTIRSSATVRRAFDDVNNSTH